MAILLWIRVVFVGKVYGRPWEMLSDSASLSLATQRRLSGTVASSNCSCNLEVHGRI